MRISYIPAPKKNCQEEFQFLKKNLKRELKACNAKEKVEIATALISFSLFKINTLAQTAEEFEQKINAKGNQILLYVKTIMFWLGIIYASIDVVKNIKNQDIMQVPKIIFRYALMVAAVYKMPKFFNFIIGFFD